MAILTAASVICAGLSAYAATRVYQCKLEPMYLVLDTRKEPAYSGDLSEVDQRAIATTLQTLNAEDCFQRAIRLAQKFDLVKFIPLGQSQYFAGENLAAGFIFIRWQINDGNFIRPPTSGSVTKLSPKTYDPGNLRVWRFEHLLISDMYTDIFQDKLKITNF